jgi:hypothetical protein
MWIFTPIGFFSVVAKQSDPNTVKVRARIRQDLENLLELLQQVHPQQREETEIYATPRRDYPYRLFLPKEVWSLLAEALASDIDYTNFKDEVKHTQGYSRAGLYMKIWSVMYNAEDKLEVTHYDRPKQPKFNF